MKKRKKKKFSKAKFKKIISKKIPFKDIKFDHSLIIILLAALILIVAFSVYSHYEIQIPSELYEEIEAETTPLGDECIINADCPQPRCPGVKNMCEKGFCVIQRVAPARETCYDLQVCGNEPC